MTQRELQDCEAMRKRLEAGAVEVDARLGRRRRTLLHHAVLSFRPDLVELLLEYSADPLLADAMGQTPHDLCRKLQEAARAGGMEIDEVPLAARMDSIAALMEYPVAMQCMFDDSLRPEPVGTEIGLPGPIPLIRLTSMGKRVMPPPPPPHPGVLTRGSSIEGSTSAASGADLALAQAALTKRLEQGVQVFSDIGLYSLLSLQERDSDGHAKLPRKGADEGTDASICLICFSAGDGQLVEAPCGLSQCGGRFCTGCLTQHIQHSVGDLRYALPLVRCPGCRSRIASSTWGQWLEAAGQAEVAGRMRLAGQALLKVRCPSCHNPRDLFTCKEAGAEIAGDDTALGEGVLVGLSPERRLALAKQVALFRHGGLAEALLDMLDDAPPAEAGRAPGLPKQAPEAVEKRFKSLLGLLGDVERATALQLAFYRRYPLIATACCQSKMCFKCKVKGHHPGQTCEARQAQECSIEAQYCPGCGVPTVKSEGCNHIVCVCGRSWDWR